MNRSRQEAKGRPPRDREEHKRVEIEYGIDHTTIYIVLEDETLLKKLFLCIGNYLENFFIPKKVVMETTTNSAKPKRSPVMLL